MTNFDTLSCSSFSAEHSSRDRRPQYGFVPTTLGFGYSYGQEIYLWLCFTLWCCLVDMLVCSRQANHICDPNHQHTTNRLAVVDAPCPSDSTVE